MRMCGLSATARKKDTPASRPPTPPTAKGPSASTALTSGGASVRGLVRDRDIPLCEEARARPEGNSECCGLTCPGVLERRYCRGWIVERAALDCPASDLL
mmetsp:Transcript_56845/g.90407  ORF Transcript_56845/g.90407 Transcript_56845/m.90407 type:complete len:100 (-) Transcript_56845:427-726(-)